MRIALGIEYDGSGFCGWQTQPSGCGVQDALDAALSQIAAGPVESQCAGRTDAGVHALEQVAHFDTTAQRPLTAWVRGVNTLLPHSIAVRWACEVAPAFHARYSARGRAY
ncbi:MAG TPA: tRNA pseudouridine synthase A, partial [Burkholderiales bacterium]|nr:tRNA pseudouridine synthase A [Burkholderiales bacterium]